MTSRPLTAVSAEGAALLPALARALDGTGPAVLPVPADPRDAAVVTAAARPDLPVEAGVAAVVTTSGSTGDPKGVLLPAAALTASARATHDLLGGPGAWLLAMSPRYVGGLQVLVRSLLADTEPVVLDLDGGFRPDGFVAASGGVEGDRRYTALVPTQLRRLLDAGGAAVAALAAYDGVLVGGAATGAALLAEARAAGVRIVTTYGMSETCGGCVYDGRPLGGVSWSFADDGRIALAGPVLAAGYRLRPELTAAVFAGGTFRTEDLGRTGDDGRLVVLGRADDVIVTGGEKVSAAAVEAVLDADPAVAASAAAGLPDPEWGQRLEAWVVPTDPAEPPDEEALRSAVRAALPRAAVPRAVHLVPALPHLPSGKVDRRALRALAAGALAAGTRDGGPA